MKPTAGVSQAFSARSPGRWYRHRCSLSQDVGPGFKTAGRPARDKIVVPSPGNYGAQQVSGRDRVQPGIRSRSATSDSWCLHNALKRRAASRRQFPDVARRAVMTNFTVAAVSAWRRFVPASAALRVSYLTAEFEIMCSRKHLHVSHTVSSNGNATVRLRMPHMMRCTSSPSLNFGTGSRCTRAGWVSSRLAVIQTLSVHLPSWPA
jgi:hypothetical protein